MFPYVEQCVYRQASSTRPWTLSMLVPLPAHNSFFFLISLMFIHFWERHTHTEHEGEGAEREGDTESKAGSRFSTEPDAGLKPIDCKIMTWAKVGRLIDWATQAPLWTQFLTIPYRNILLVCKMLSKLIPILKSRKKAPTDHPTYTKLYLTILTS